VIGRNSQRGVVSRSSTIASLDICPADPSDVGQGLNVPNRDGRRFLINTPVGDPAMVPITVALNWIAGLKK
jgi:hypothetical protein